MDVDQCDANYSDENISYPATQVIRGMLRELLTLPDYSITQIATEINVSTATIRRLLQGDTLQPSVRTFDKIIRLYCAACHRIYANQPNNNPTDEST